MSAGRNETIWIPLALGIAGVILGLALTKYWSGLPDWVSALGVLAAIVLIAWAIYLAYQSRQTDRRHGGAGGNAFAAGEDSQATGGVGGDAGRGDGGQGGTATAKGLRSIARGGSGGRG